MRLTALCLLFLTLCISLSFSEGKILSLEETLNLLEKKLLFCEEASLRQEKRIADLLTALQAANDSSLFLEKELAQALALSEMLKVKIADYSEKLEHVSSLLASSKKHSENLEKGIAKQIRVLKWQRIGLWALLAAVVVETVALVIK